ncbi:MAG: ROK family protein [Spirochaetaceae bacterium]|jgi:glucokinase|nr:ROK family protein [Spirochaetaceae bacterium]
MQIGIDIGGTKTAVTVWDNETLVRKIRFTTPGGPDAAITAIETAAREALAGNVPAVCGLCCGGPLDSRRGLILSPPNLPGWDEVPITRILEDRFGCPCLLENDANACAVAEWRWGAGQSCQNMIFLTFGTGMGAGLILDGRLYRGALDLAGEAGHIRLAEDGPEGYGKRGSFEGFCSGGGISRAYAARTGVTISAAEVCERAAHGEKTALDVTGQCAFYLGRALAILIDLLNPDRIVLGSIYARAAGLFTAGMEAALLQEALPLSRRRCAILPAALGEELGDRAALAVALRLA